LSIKTILTKHEQLIMKAAINILHDRHDLNECFCPYIIKQAEIQVTEYYIYITNHPEDRIK
jgi:hypothetical protein